MIKRLLMFFLIYGMSCALSIKCGADALPTLPPLPSLDGFSSLSPMTSGESAVSTKQSLVDVKPASRSNVLDTDGLDSQGKDLSGSWWKKRHWSLKARELQEKINSLVADIQALGSPLYDTKRAAFNKDTSTFYEKIGMEQGKTDALLEELAPYFNPSSKDVTLKSVSHISSSKKFQDYFDATVMVAQLKADLKAIVDLDAGVGERVAQFEKCSQQALQKAAEAQVIINEMFSLVSHDAARDSYYKLEGIVTYLEAVVKFLKTDLAGDLDRVIGLARTKMDEVAKVVVNARNACEAIEKSSDSAVDVSVKKDVGQTDAKGEDVVAKEASPKLRAPDVAQESFEHSQEEHASEIVRYDASASEESSELSLIDRAAGFIARLFGV